MSQRASDGNYAGTLELFDLYGLSEEERRIERVLARHQGKDRAIQVEVLSAITSLGSVKVRKVVRDLIVTHGMPIGSSVMPPAGYYWIVDREEIEENYRKLRHRGIAVLQRAACLRRIGLRELLRRLQTELDFSTSPEI